MASILSTPCLVLAQEKEESPSAIQHMWDFVKTKAELAWNKVYYYLSFKVEERTPEAEAEFIREIEEIKNEAPSLWQRFLDLIYWTPNQ